MADPPPLWIKGNGPNCVRELGAFRTPPIRGDYFDQDDWSELEDWCLSNLYGGLAIVWWGSQCILHFETERDRAVFLGKYFL